MLPIRGVYEVAVRVRDLERAEQFYTGPLGLEVALRDPRGMLFLRVGASAGMVVLQQDSGDWPGEHFALTIDAVDVDEAAKQLREAGVEVEGPVHHAWMPARSLYFSDPDGHQLELCAPLEV